MRYLMKTNKDKYVTINQEIAKELCKDAMLANKQHTAWMMIELAWNYDNGLDVNAVKAAWLEKWVVTKAKERTMTLLQAIDLAKLAVQDYENSFEIFKRLDNGSYFFAIFGTVRNSSIFQYVGYVSIAGVFVKRSY